MATGTLLARLFCILGLSTHAKWMLGLGMNTCRYMTVINEMNQRRSVACNTGEQSAAISLTQMSPCTSITPHQAVGVVDQTEGATWVKEKDVVKGGVAVARTTCASLLIRPPFLCSDYTLLCKGAVKYARVSLLVVYMRQAMSQLRSELSHLGTTRARLCQTVISTSNAIKCSEFSQVVAKLLTCISCCLCSCCVAGPVLLSAHHWFTNS